jgi:hypothetical protein
VFIGYFNQFLRTPEPRRKRELAHEAFNTCHPRTEMGGILPSLSISEEIPAESGYF